MRTGPPNVKPYMFWWSVSLAVQVVLGATGVQVEKKLVASMKLLRMNSKPEPWKVLVPERVTTLTRPPEWALSCAPRAVDSTLNWETASGKGKGRLELAIQSLLSPPSRRQVVVLPVRRAMETEMAA